MNNYTKEYISHLTKRLLSIKNRKVHFDGNQKWIIMRCPLCGDSKTDPNKTRMGIKVGIEDGEIPMFKCFNCNQHGRIDYLLPILFPDDYEMTSMTAQYYKQARLNPKFKKYQIVKKKKVSIKQPFATEYNLRKIQYVNKRLGIKLSNQDLIKYKIVVDFYQFLGENGIKKLSRDKRICDSLEKDYIGFLSVNNEYINMRNFVDSHKNNKYLKRYEIYNIFNLDDNTKKYYVITNTIDIMQDVEIHVAEGAFDIIGVFNHIYNKDDKNRLFVAVCGSDYASVIKSIIIDYGILFNKVFIYSDNEPDKDIRFYKDLKKQLGDRIGEMKVFYNKLGKDFGVTKEEIDYKYTII